MPTLYSVVVPAFFAIFIGFMFGKLWKPDMRTVVDVALYIGVPALVFTSLMEKQVDLLDAARVWSAALVVELGCLLAGYLVFKALRQKHSGLIVPIGIMNTVNLPFPILYLAYGAAALVPATLYYIPNVILMFSLGIYIMSGGNRAALKEVLRQPVIYAAVLGLILSISKVTVPDLVLNSLDLVAQVTVPLVLIVLGYNLSKVRISSFWTTLLASFLRMAGGLALGLLMANVLGLTGLTRSVVVIVSAMPAAANSSILAAKYDNEAEEVSSVVFLTTVAALGVIPLLLHFYG